MNVWIPVLVAIVVVVSSNITKFLDLVIRHNPTTTTWTPIVDNQVSCVGCMRFVLHDKDMVSAIVFSTFVFMYEMIKYMYIIMG